jgi:prepilin-type N-terminal cleavage/methylation domain-containing protein
MLTFLTSRICSSSRKGTYSLAKGFTLVELLVSIGIIGIVSSIVLVKYNTFDSTVLLKSLAYEIALSLREAQVRSVSVSGTSGEFDYPFGISFSLGKQYVSFLHTGTDEYPVYGGVDTTDLRTFSIDRTMEIIALCIDVGSGEVCNAGIERLDVSFRRPKFTGLFHAEGSGESSSDIESATIKVGSATPGNVFAVKVTNLGQISVYKE